MFLLLHTFQISNHRKKKAPQGFISCSELVRITLMQPQEEAKFRHLSWCPGCSNTYEVSANFSLMICLTEMETGLVFSGVTVMDWNKSPQTMPRSAGRAGFAGQASLLSGPLGVQRCQCANSLGSNTHHSIHQLISTLSDEDVAQVCWKTEKSWRASAFTSGGGGDDFYYLDWATLSRRSNSIKSADTYL